MLVSSKLIQIARMQSLERILYVWAIRHPASGYVQGINDLVTPFFQVFLSSYIGQSPVTPPVCRSLADPLADSDPESYDVSALPPSVLEALEADSFWCLSKLLDGIQDNYIFAQPGITRQVARMKELCARVDGECRGRRLSVNLADSFAHSAARRTPRRERRRVHSVRIQVDQLLAHARDERHQYHSHVGHVPRERVCSREKTSRIADLLDVEQAEGGDAFSEFHLYVCLAFLVKWSDQLREMDFQVSRCSSE